MARVCRDCHKVLAKGKDWFCVMLICLLFLFLYQDGDAEISTPSQNTFEKFQHRLKGIQIPTFRNSKRKSRASVLNEVVHTAVQLPLHTYTVHVLYKNMEGY